MKTFAAIFFVSFAIALNSCKDDDKDSQPSTEDITLEFISEDLNDHPIDVTFTVVSITIDESSDKKYYNFEYEIEIKNTGSTLLEFTDNLIQAYLIDGTDTYAAAGKQVDDFQLEPDGTFTITWSANSAQVLPDGLNINGMTLQINVYQNSDQNDLIAQLEYLITFEE